MPRRDEKVSDPDPDDEDLPTIADEQPIRRIARPGGPPIPVGDDEEPTIEAPTVDAPTLQKPGSGVRAKSPPAPPSKAQLGARPPPSPRSPSGQFLVPNVPVPTRPPSINSGARAAPSAKVPENFGETIETSHNAFDSMGAQRPASPQSSSAYESTQYLISAVKPHPLAKSELPAPVQPEPQPVPPPKVYVPPPPQPIPPPPIALIVVAVLLALFAMAAIIYVLARR